MHRTTRSRRMKRSAQTADTFLGFFSSVWRGSLGGAAVLGVTAEVKMSLQCCIKASGGKTACKASELSGLFQSGCCHVRSLRLRLLVYCRAKTGMFWVKVVVSVFSFC